MAMSVKSAGQGIQQRSASTIDPGGSSRGTPNPAWRDSRVQPVLDRWRRERRSALLRLAEHRANGDRGADREVFDRLRRFHLYRSNL